MPDEEELPPLVPDMAQALRLLKATHDNYREILAAIRDGRRGWRRSRHAGLVRPAQPGADRVRVLGPPDPAAARALRVMSRQTLPPPPRRGRVGVGVAA